jgi:hypothetical protein
VTLALFTVTVLTCVTGVDVVDLVGELAHHLQKAGLLDAAITGTAFDVGFTAQVWATGVVDAAKKADAALLTAGLPEATSITVELEEEDETVLPRLAVV